MSVSTQRPAEDTVAPIRSGGRGAAQLASGATSGPRIFAEHVTAASLAIHRDAWADLCGRSLEPNVFFDPAFALPLLQHAGRRSRIGFLLVWEDCEPVLFNRLLGLFPMETPRTWFSATARGWAHEQTSCGTPLVDASQAAVVLETVLTWLDGPRGRSATLALTGLAADGAFLAALRRLCGETARRLAVLDTRERAVLHRPDEANEPAGAGSRIASFASAKRRKERARQLRRLSESGVRVYASARSPSDVAAAIERFLTLEFEGWKGTRKTALLADPSLATFARTMTRSMARDGRCRIDSIEIDGRPIAMGIVLSAADQAYFWKTTFDESYASFSPGVQLTLELTRTQLADAQIAMTDSCAIANHPMIDRVWPDRAAAVDVMVAVRPGREMRFDRSLRTERLRLTLRRVAKFAWHRVRGGSRR